MRTYIGIMNEPSRRLLISQIGQRLLGYQITDEQDGGRTTFETVGLVFPTRNLKLSCSCDHYDYSQQRLPYEMDISVFNVVDCHQDKIPSPYRDSTLKDYDVDEVLTQVELYRENVLTRFSDGQEDDTIIQDRGIAFIFETKKLVLLKGTLWTDTLDVFFVDKNWKIPPSREWRDADGESYTVTDSVEIIKPDSK